MCCRDRIFGSSKSHNQPRTTAGVCCRDRYPTDRLRCTDSCLTSHHQAIFAVHVYIFQLTTRVLSASWVLGQEGNFFGSRQQRRTGAPSPRCASPGWPFARIRAARHRVNGARARSIGAVRRRCEPWSIDPLPNLQPPALLPVEPPEEGCQRLTFDGGRQAAESLGKDIRREARWRRPLDRGSS